MQELQSALEAACQKLFDVDVELELTRPEEKFGDYTSNAGLQLGQQLGRSPRAVADILATELRDHPWLADVQVAGQGYLNFKLTDEAQAKATLAATELPAPLKGQEILVEFGDPNPFKEMHIGHLYSYIVGDAIASLLEANGALVRRLSYHGDVGLHVAKAIFGLRALDDERKKENKNLSGVPTIEREDFLGVAYAYGAQKYESDAAAKHEIAEINNHIYARDDPAINQLHKEGSELSFSYFDEILALLNIKTDKRYLESQTLEPGTQLVAKNLGTVFQLSQGATVFEGEKVGLHTRVFITSKGLPTYETKDLGLSVLKDQDYPEAARSIIVTANEQSEYFKVMLAAMAEINPALAQKTTHLSHGFLNLSSGKMSSRTGNVYAAMQLLLAVKAAVHEQYPDSAVRKEVTFAAVKYALLKHRLGADIVLDIKESVSLEGNSGPYLQYAHARAQSILAKAGGAGAGEIGSLEPAERSLARKISEYPEVVAKATAELMPHYIGTYLYELAQNFNRFYEANRVIGDPRQPERTALVVAYAKVLGHGLKLLNIPAPNKM